jgi:hypothetical protein
VAVAMLVVVVELAELAVVVVAELVVAGRPW